jgi:hypothetical protein
MIRERRPGASEDERFSPDAQLVFVLPGKIVTGKAVFEFAFTFVGWV